MTSEDDLISDLAGILRNFQDREYSGEIAARTLFFGDLGFVSIDAVVLGETLENHYGQEFPFNELLAEVGQSEAQDIEVGQLAVFLSKNMKPK